MDPDAALRMIDEADRVDAETREVIRKAYVGSPKVHATKKVTRHDSAGARGYAVVARDREIDVGDIVQRSDIAGKNRYVVVNIQAPWIYTRRISGSGGPGIITFPSPHMLRKVS